MDTKVYKQEQKLIAKYIKLLHKQITGVRKHMLQIGYETDFDKYMETLQSQLEDAERVYRLNKKLYDKNPY